MPTVYTVDNGDTLFGIAQRFYGDGMKFPIIAQANGITNPNLIFPGQVLQIPDLAPPPPQPTPQPPPQPQPEPPPQPFDFRLLRPADLLNLHCTAIGCRVSVSGDPGGGGPPMTTHTVVPGDTLWDLAQRFYGDPRLFPLIAAANHIPNPNLILPGQVLIIPQRPAPPPPPPTATHVVVPGDTLWDLAKRFYGDPFRYHEIAAANHIANPDLIIPGQKLVIPGLPGPPDPNPTPGPTPGSRLVAVTDDAHIIVRFGVQNLLEEKTETKPPVAPPPIARARAANDSRVVFELPKGSEIPFTVSAMLHALTALGVRVPPLAVPRLREGEQRPPEASVPLAAPAPDETAIEAPYRLIVSPDASGGFTHAAEAATAPDDSNRVELWHSRLGVRRIVDGVFTGVDEDDDVHRTVRAVWERDREQPAAPPFPGSLTPNDRAAIVRQTADPKVLDAAQKPIEPEPLNVERLYLSALGAWIDWRVGWPRVDEYGVGALSAYRHLAPLGRDSYVRVEKPVYLYPPGNRATLVRITERKVKSLDNGDDPTAYLFTRSFLVLRERTRTYTDEECKRLPFTSVTIDPLVSPDLDAVDDDISTAFVPKVSGQPYLWKLTGVDHAGRQVTMMTGLVAVPRGAHPGARAEWNTYVTQHGPIDMGGADVAFAPERIPGDTTNRTQYIDFTGDAAELTSTPWMVRAHITVPALAAINKGGGPVPVRYPKSYVDNGFNEADPAQLFLNLDSESKLDFAGGSDRGGGFIEPSVAVNAISRTQGAVGDAGNTPGKGIAAGKFDPAAILGGALPKLFGLFDLIEILVGDGPLSQAPKLIADQLDLVTSVAADFGNLVKALEKARETLDLDIASTTTAGAKQRLQDLRNKVQQSIDSLAANPVLPLLDALRAGPPASGGPNPAAGPAGQILTALATTDTLRTNPFLPAYLRALIERPFRSVKSALETALDGAKLATALQSALESSTIRYEWTPPIKEWKGVFIPNEPDTALAIAVEIRTSKDGEPQSDVSAQLRNFKLQLLPGESLMAMKFGRIGFRVATGGKPEVDVQFDGMEFLGALGFIEKLRQLIPFDGFADPPYVDVTPEGATAGFDLALPSVAVGVFTLENISLAADCRVPFLGEAVTVGFGFCSKESPFRLTVMAIGGGGWVGIRLAPKGLVMLEMGLEAGAALSVDLGVASGSVSVMVGVYLRLEDKKGQLTAYFRIRGEVEVLGIASASITLELSLRYDFDSGKLIGRASLQVEVEVLFFSASVEITVERKLAGSKGDPALADIMPPAGGGQALWDQYFSSFAIGA
jgi:LysM repeat protein